MTDYCSQPTDQSIMKTCSFAHSYTPVLSVEGLRLNILNPPNQVMW